MEDNKIVLEADLITDRSAAYSNGWNGHKSTLVVEHWNAHYAILHIEGNQVMVSYQALIDALSECKNM